MRTCHPGAGPRAAGGRAMGLSLPRAALRLRPCELPKAESEAAHGAAGRLHLCFGASTRAAKPWPYGCTPTATLETS